MQGQSVSSNDDLSATITAWEMAIGAYRLTGFLQEDPAAGTVRAWVNDNGTTRAATDRVFRGALAWDDAWDHLAELREIYERKFLAHLKQLRGR
jgi:hypothetical protein